MRRAELIWATSWALALAGVLSLYYAAPYGGRGQSLAYNLTGAAVAVILLVGARLRPRGARRGWILLACGTALFSIGDFVWDYYEWFKDGQTPFPSIADVVYLLAYPALAAGIVLIVPWRRVPLGDLLDVGVLTASVGGVMWFAWIAPQASAGGNSQLERVVSAAYPTMDFLLLAVLVYAAFAAAAWPTYIRVVVGGIALLLGTDLLYSRMLLDGTYSVGSWLDAGWMAYYLALAAAALHPQRATADAEPRTRQSARWGRFVIVGSAALLLPAALLSDATGTSTIMDGWAPAGFATAIVLLVILRMATLIREQNAFESELRRGDAERTRLLRRSVEAAEQERSRVARDLHDGPIQAMTAIAFKLDLLGRRMTRAGGAEAALADEVRQDVAAEIASLRRVMAELRPPVLDERGLSIALADCAGTVLDGSGVAFSMRTTLNGTRPAREVETVVYRVTREALINVRKHAHARSAEVVLEELDDALHLVVRDDGAGFDEGDRSDTIPHLGVVGMQEGVASLGGTFQLVTAPGGGTTIDAVLPWTTL